MVDSEHSKSSSTETNGTESVSWKKTMKFVFVKLKIYRYQFSKPELDESRFWKK